MLPCSAPVDSVDVVWASLVAEQLSAGHVDNSVVAVKLHSPLAKPVSGSASPRESLSNALRQQAAVTAHSRPTVLSCPPAPSRPITPGRPTHGLGVFSILRTTYLTVPPAVSVP